MEIHRDRVVWRQDADARDEFLARATMFDGT